MTLKLVGHNVQIHAGTAKGRRFIAASREMDWATCRELADEMRKWITKKNGERYKGYKDVRVLLLPRSVAGEELYQVYIDYAKKTELAWPIKLRDFAQGYLAAIYRNFETRKPGRGNNA